MTHFLLVAYMKWRNFSLLLFAENLEKIQHFS